MTDASMLPPEEEGSRPSSAPDTPDAGPEDPAAAPFFILYLEGDQYVEALRGLIMWTHHLLLPVYGREVSSTTPWCSRWWEHEEAVAMLHGLWLAWQSHTRPEAGLTGPVSWHRDCLAPTMNVLRDARGPFAGCKPGAHRAKVSPPVDELYPFGAPERIGQ
ncbi:DUF4913 domain-containing protein [Streptomyces massasporeus]|uniref:DUF4913 domain-containing protein n=1 Tax=Streptomyces massasporeus TaxID=67324 RepID=UPI0037BB6A30